MCSHNSSFYFKPCHLLISMSQTILHFLRKSIRNLQYISKIHAKTESSPLPPKKIEIFYTHTSTKLPKIMLSYSFPNSSKSCLFSHLHCHQSQHYFSLMPVCYIPETCCGLWPCFLGCARLTRVHMLVSEEELTLNQPSFANCNLQPHLSAL